MAPAEVDLVVNCFERTYRKVLEPGHLARIAAENRYPFARRVVVINNVDDRADAARRADALVASGEITEWHFVADHLERAYRVTGLAPEDLGRIPYFTDFLIVAVTLPGSPWVLHWDADVTLETPSDWITPAIAYMEKDPRILVANPNWEGDTLPRETLEDHGDIAVTQGMSDQVFLARRADLARPIYKHKCLARLRYPLAHVGDIFEARLDAYMRHHGRLRAVYKKARYLHPATFSYPQIRGMERVRYWRNHWFLKAVYASPWKPRCLRTI